MTLLKVGSGVYVSVDEIVLLQTFPSRPSRRDKHAAESAGVYRDATTGTAKREPLRTLVHLRCGLVIGSPLTPDALARRSPVSSPVKMSTRRNNLEGARIVTGEEGVPIERTPPPPFTHPKNTNPRAIAEREPEPPGNAGESTEEEREDETEKGRGFGLNGLKRLMRRD